MHRRNLSIKHDEGPVEKVEEKFETSSFCQKILVNL